MASTSVHATPKLKLGQMAAMDKRVGKAEEDAHEDDGDLGRSKAHEDDVRKKRVLSSKHSSPPQTPQQRARARPSTSYLGAADRKHKAASAA